jgi:hypothetical protein
MGISLCGKNYLAQNKGNLMTQKNKSVNFRLMVGVSMNKNEKELFYD